MKYLIDVIKEKYGEPLVLFMNSWGHWNSGGTRILNTTIDIPAGSWWAKWSDCKRRYMVAYSGADGWPARKLPDWAGNILSILRLSPPTEASLQSTVHSMRRHRLGFYV